MYRQLTLWFYRVQHSLRSILCRVTQIQIHTKSWRFLCLSGKIIQYILCNLHIPNETVSIPPSTTIFRALLINNYESAPYIKLTFIISSTRVSFSFLNPLSAGKYSKIVFTNQIKMQKLTKEIEPQTFQPAAQFLFLRNRNLSRCFLIYLTLTCDNALTELYLLYTKLHLFNCISHNSSPLSCIL